MLAYGGGAQAASTEPAPQAGPAPTVLRRWASTQGGDQVLTEAQAIANATNYDLVVGRVKTYEPYLAKMRAVNPDIKMISYLNGTYSSENTQANYPDAWHLHDSSGRPIMSIVGQNYLMDPRNNGWVADRTNECANDLDGTGWDGCYVDMLGGASVAPDYVTQVPTDPRTGQPWTLVDWIAATSRLGAAVKAGNPGKMIVVNGLSNGSVYFDPKMGPSARLLDGTDGGNAQGWLRAERTPVTDFRIAKKWRNEVGMLVDAESRGKSVLTMTKISVPGQTQADVDRWHRYTIASFLLGTNGNQYMFFTTDASGSPIGPDAPMDHVNPGLPTGPMSMVSGGAYVRDFSAGMAMVNPTLAAVTIPLPRPMTNLSGRIVSSVTLPSYTGEVLTF